MALPDVRYNHHHVTDPQLTYKHQRMHACGDSKFRWSLNNGVFWYMPSSGLLVIQRERAKSPQGTPFIQSLHSQHLTFTKLGSFLHRVIDEQASLQGRIGTSIFVRAHLNFTPLK